MVMHLKRYWGIFLYTPNYNQPKNSRKQSIEMLFTLRDVFELSINKHDTNILERTLATYYLYDIKFAPATGR
jgi:hypothetical protein